MNTHETPTSEQLVEIDICGYSRRLKLMSNQSAEGYTQNIQAVSKAARENSQSFANVIGNAILQVAKPNDQEATNDFLNLIVASHFSLQPSDIDKSEVYIDAMHLCTAYGGSANQLMKMLSSNSEFPYTIVVVSFGDSKIQTIQHIENLIQYSEVSKKAIESLSQSDQSEIKKIIKHVSELSPEVEMTKQLEFALSTLEKHPESGTSALRVIASIYLELNQEASVVNTEPLLVDLNMITEKLGVKLTDPKLLDNVRNLGLASAKRQGELATFQSMQDFGLTWITESLDQIMTSGTVDEHTLEKIAAIEPKILTADLEAQLKYIVEMLQRAISGAAHLEEINQKLSQRTSEEQANPTIH